MYKQGGQLYLNGETCENYFKMPGVDKHFPIVFRDNLFKVELVEDLPLGGVKGHFSFWCFDY